LPLAGIRGMRTREDSPGESIGRLSGVFRKQREWFRMGRIATIQRETKETTVAVTFDLDGQGRANIATGLPFFDHMLGGMTRHGYFDLEVRAQGDLEVDPHHTVEDVGLVLGQAIREALGEKRGIRRFGMSIVPMDEALVRAVIDISGRPWIAYSLHPEAAEVGGIPVLLFREFFRALAARAAITLHLEALAGDEPHHMIEAAFKAFGRALDQATGTEPRAANSAPSTKGVIE